MASAVPTNKRQNPTKHVKVELPCAQCGKLVLKFPRPVVFCSWEHRADYQYGADRPGNAPRSVRVPVNKSPSAASPRPARALPATPKPRLFISGPCEGCPRVFTRNAGSKARYCSASCARDMQEATRRLTAGDLRWYIRSYRRRQFSIPRSVRRAIYDRDNWTCQLCGDPVDGTLPRGDPWSATLDHIVCQSWVDVPDDSPENLRLAHLRCNSRRNDERYVTAAELWFIYEDPAQRRVRSKSRATRG